MRVALYARVSTIQQSSEFQISEIQRYCQLRDWNIAGSYVDTMSGRKSSRPELNRLIQDAFLGKLDAVVVWKLDRFGRSLKDLVDRISELNSCNVKFVSVTDALDFTTPGGRFQFQVLSAVAEFEASLIRERIKASLALAKQNGKILGRKKELPEAKILTLKHQGLSNRAVAKELGCSEGGVRLVLKRS